MNSLQNACSNKRSARNQRSGKRFRQAIKSDRGTERLRHLCVRRMEGRMSRDKCKTHCHDM